MKNRLTLYTNEHGEELAAAETDVVEVSDEILYSML